jgi:transposase
MVFNEADVLAKNLKPDLTEEIVLDSYTAVEDSNKKEILVKEHTKKIRGHRKPLPKNLPREVCRIELPESERVSADGVTPLKIIGYEVSEKLVYEPA